MEKKQSRLKYSKKERRKRFFNKVSMEMYHKSKGDTKPVHGWGNGKTKVMSNADRRRMGIEQDPDLPDYSK